MHKARQKGKRNRILVFSALCLIALTLTLIDNNTHRIKVGTDITAGPGGGKAGLIASFQRLPLYFEPNAGQADDEVEFLTRGRGYTLFLTSDQAVLSLRHGRDENTSSASGSDVLTMTLPGSKPDPDVCGLERLPGQSNYLLGHDPSAWHTRVPHYAAVEYRDVYPGVDLQYYGRQGQLEYDFIVAPGADPGPITMEFDGVQRCAINSRGDLVLTLENGEAVFERPAIFQEDGTGRRFIEGGFAFKDEERIGFDLDAYDPALPLIIDPKLLFSTYLGGSGEDDYGYDIAVDDKGSVYVTGKTASDYFPTTAGVLQRELKHSGQYYGGNADAFVTKLSPDGSALIYSTYFGGAGDDEGRGIAVDGNGCAHITGITWSWSIPVKHAVQAESPGGGDINPETYDMSGDGFVAKFNADGSDLVYSTFLGSCEGTDFGSDIALDQNGNAYVTGYTHFGQITDAWKQEFPTTPGSFNPKPPYNTDNAFVTKFKPDGSLDYSTIIRSGDNGYSLGTGIAVDKDGNAYITGRGWYSATDGAYDYNPEGQSWLVSKLNASGTALFYTARLGPVGGWTWHGSDTYAGSPGDIAVDALGNAYVTGRTTEGFPTTAGAIKSEAERGDFFLTKLDATGSTLLYSTLIKGHWGVQGGGFAGAALDVPNRTEGGIAIDSDGYAYITGAIDNAEGFPQVDAVQSGFGGGWDAFIIKLDPNPANPSPVIYSTFLGGSGQEYGLGIAVAANGTAYITGQTNSADFPVTENAYQKDRAGWWDALVAGVGGRMPLLYDQVVIGAQPIFTPLAGQSQQILPQAEIDAADATVNFTFEGKSSDGWVGLRVNNTRVTDRGLPLNLIVRVFDPDGDEVGLHSIPNINADNVGVRFQVTKDGQYEIVVAVESDSRGPFPAPFQIHLSGNVGLPRKLINEKKEKARGTRLDILFNHPAPRPQILAGKDSLVAQTGLFKFANPVSVFTTIVAVMLPPQSGGFPVGNAILRAADPLVLGQLRPGVAVDPTTPTARTPEWNRPRIGRVIDFTQVPVPCSVEECPPPPPFEKTVLSLFEESDGIGISLPLETADGTVSGLIFDMGAGQEIVNGEGSDFRVYAPSGNYSVSAGNTPYLYDLIPLAQTAAGTQEFDLGATGLTSARYLLINAAPEVVLDAIHKLNMFCDEVRSDIGPAFDVADATITMRRSKAPELEFDPFLELIAPDGTWLGENESGFGDGLSLDLSDAALIGIGLSQVGFYRFLGRGYHQIPNMQSFGDYFVRLESSGWYDTDKILMSDKSESETVAQKSREITSTKQRDSYLFQATPGRKYNIVLTALNESLNPLLELYDPEGFLIAASDDYPDRHRDAVLSLNLPANGQNRGQPLPNQSTYRVVVSAIDQWDDSTTVEGVNYYLRELSGGRYELKIFTGDLEGTKPVEPSIDSLSPNRAVRGASGKNVDINGTGFDSAAQVSFSGEGIKINSTRYVSASQLSVEISISADALPGARDVTVTNGSGLKTTKTAAFVIVERVGLAVMNWDPPTLTGGLAPPSNLTVTLGGGALGKKPAAYSLLFAPIVEVEPNNSLEQAQVLSGGPAVTVRGRAEVEDEGSIIFGDDDIEDLYKVTLLSAGLEIRLDSLTSDCSLALFDETFDNFALSAAEGATEPEMMWDPSLPAGTYYIGVSIYDPAPIGGNSTPYELTVTGELEGGSTAPVLTAYNIYRSEQPNARENGVLAGTAPATQTRYSDAPPDLGTYYYQVTAQYDMGESAPSNEESVLLTEIRERNGEIPDGLVLEQNYPNPFNPSTTIRYSIPENGRVEIAISDVRGRRLRTLVAEDQTAGGHQVVWYGRDDAGRKAASGVYLYTIKNKGHMKTRKLLLLK